MKTLNFIPEASANGVNFNVVSFMFNDGEQKSHVAFSYDHNNDTVSILTWDDFSDLASNFGTDADDPCWADLDNLTPGESSYDALSCVTYFKVR